MITIAKRAIVWRSRFDKTDASDSLGVVNFFHIFHGLLHYPRAVSFSGKPPCGKVVRMNDLIQVQIKGLLPTPEGVGVFLANESKMIAIFVDAHVGLAISMFLNKEKKPRPLTHDLMVAMMSGLGVRLQKVVINDLKGDTFYARLYLYQENEMGKNIVELDARPSDSIALAVQQQCPIYVSRAVWEKTADMTTIWQQAMESLHGSEPEPSPPSDDDEDEEADSEGDTPDV